MLRDGDVRPPNSKKTKAWPTGESKVLVFGLLRVVGKTALLRGVCVDESCVGMPLSNHIH